jgi:hypothetical protein
MPVTPPPIHPTQSQLDKTVGDDYAKTPPFFATHWRITTLVSNAQNWTRLTDRARTDLVECIIETMSTHGEDKFDIFGSCCTLIYRIICSDGVQLWDIILPLLRLIHFHHALKEMRPLPAAMALLAKLAEITKVGSKPQYGDLYTLFREEYKLYGGPGVMCDITQSEQTPNSVKTLAKKVQSLMAYKRRHAHIVSSSVTTKSLLSI